VKLPHNGPLRLVLRRLNLLAATARVLSLQGDPIAGAQVSAQILTPIGNEGMLQSREAKVTSKPMERSQSAIYDRMIESPR
jgi:hypothetical protein